MRGKAKWLRLLALRFAKENNLPIDDARCISLYFNALYTWTGDGLDVKNIMGEIRDGINGCMLPFRQISEQFRLIGQSTQTLYIPEEGTEELFAELCSGKYSQDLFRKLGRHAVSVYDNQLEQLKKQGLVEEPGSGIFTLKDLSAYDQGVGLIIS